ncbi:hypothetical protein QBC37DRAFT_398460 [Rhypophila decipiens]|uniref:F-box domain-containing protein n=1 Tax=Rhypophila decipiens TaxID=261697 RepID=A0AAN6YG64_9PEZI|nr:hypothetical protein QBC37DRAFT_398460 [Rhypophila decipiens]
MNVLSRLNSWLGSLQLAWAVSAGNLPTSRPTSRGYMEFHVIKTTAIPKDLILHKFPLEILIEILDQVDVTDLPALASLCKVLRALAEPLLPTRAAKDPILGRHALVWAADTVQYGSLVIKPESAVEWRFSALYLAVSRGDEAAVRLLLQSGADLNQPCCEPCHPDFPHEGCWRKWWPQNTCNVWNTLQMSVAQRYGSITRLLREHLAVSGEPGTTGGPGLGI